MQYVCDAGALTWFRLDSRAEAAEESRMMQHAVESYFDRAYRAAVAAYKPPANVPTMEQNIGLKAFVARTMPRFLTLRNNEGEALVTAMLPPEGKGLKALTPVIVAAHNADPYVEHANAIDALASHVGFELAREVCFPYRR